MSFSVSTKYSASRCLPLMKDSNGAPVASVSQKAQTQFDHFAGIELADNVSQEELSLDCHSVQPPQITSLSITNVMSPHELHIRFATANKGRAAGDDLVTNDLLHLDLHQFTRLYHPLHTKMALTASEPLRLKGSIAHPVEKKGSPQGRQLIGGPSSSGTSSLSTITLSCAPGSTPLYIAPCTLRKQAVSKEEERTFLIPSYDGHCICLKRSSNPPSHFLPTYDLRSTP